MKKIPLTSLLALVLLPGLTLADGQTTRISVNNARVQGNQSSYYASISADGRYVAFLSDANNLVVGGDTNGVSDIFVRDRKTGETERVSVDSAGKQGNGSSFGRFAISADGRHVVFESSAKNLVSGDTNGQKDIFVHDRLSGKTSRVSVDSAGVQSNSYSYSPSISADGRYVAFVSNADNLVDGDSNNVADVFVHDRQTGKTTRVSVNSDGSGANEFSGSPSISADGRLVAFDSGADNLVPVDTNRMSDVFVHDRQTGQTALVSVDSVGKQGNNHSFDSFLSANGRYVAFVSLATNLVEGGTKGWHKVFVHDRNTGKTELASVDSAGTQGNEYSVIPSISADGRYVAFASHADNLVSGDTNGYDDVFVHDRKTGKTERVSVNSAGKQGNSISLMTLVINPSAISADGRYIAFESYADNLVAGDTNKKYDVFVRDRLLQTQRQSDVSLTLTGPASVTKGSDAIYKFKVINNGIINAGNTHLIGVISNQGNLKNIVTTQGTCVRSAVPVCHLGRLNPGQSVTVTATITVKDSMTVKATVQSAPKDSLPRNNTASIGTKVQ